MNNMKKITRISFFLKWITFSFLLLLPLTEAGYWITEGYPFLSSFCPVGSLPSYNGVLVEWSQLTNLQKLLGFLSNMLPLSFSIMALFYLGKLFSSFEKLELFEKANVSVLRKAGWFLVWGQIVFPIYQGLLSIALTYNRPVGERNISLGIGGDQCKVLIIGLSVLLVSWIFEQAVSLREEHEGTI